MAGKMNEQAELALGAGRTEDVLGLGLDVMGWDNERSSGISTQHRNCENGRPVGGDLYEWNCRRHMRLHERMEDQVGRKYGRTHGFVE